MSTITMGELYDPGCKFWEESSQFNYHPDGDCELVLFLEPTSADIEAVASGRSEFRLYYRDRLVVLCYRFEHPKGGIPWSSTPYSYHRVPEHKRVPAPDPRKLSADSRALLHVVLVNATGGRVLAVQSVSLIPEFTRALYTASGHQAVRAIDQDYDRRLKQLYTEFPTADRLAEACSVGCETGE
jgi:hypothetical protein